MRQCLLSHCMTRAAPAPESATRVSVGDRAAKDGKAGLAGIVAGVIPLVGTLIKLVLIVGLGAQHIVAVGQRRARTHHAEINPLVYKKIALNRST
jgi:hypothetical protein